MVKNREAIVVEGRYDKNTLSQIVDAPILESDRQMKTSFDDSERILEVLILRLAQEVSHG